MTRPQRTQIYQNILIDSTRWDGLRLRPGDIVISTPPKAGTTWMQMICALLIFQKTEFGKPLSVISPWLDLGAGPIEDVVRELDSQTHRRFIKTHTPLDGLPFSDEVTYLCVARDPRDVYLSWDNHWKNLNPEFLLRATTAGAAAPTDPPSVPAAPSEPATPEQLRKQFHAWIADDGLPWQGSALGASLVLYHVKTFWDFRHLPNIHLLHYADLRADLEGEMRRIAALLGIDVPEQRWPTLVEAARFESMKARADDLAPEVDKKLWWDNQRFFDKARSGEWRDILGPEELALYEKAMRERLEPELTRWLENGRLD